MLLPSFNHHINGSVQSINETNLADDIITI